MSMIQHKVIMAAQDFPTPMRETEKEVNAATNQIEDKICNQPG